MIDRAQFASLIEAHRTQILNLQTPCYVFFRAALVDHLKSVASLISNKIDLVYSVKANPNVELLRVLNGYVHGFDVSTLGEAKLVHSLGSMDSTRVSFIGPAKTLAANLEFLNLFPDGTIVIESVDELEELSSWATENHRLIRVMLRVDFDEKTSPSGRTIQQPLQFGLTETETLAALQTHTQKSGVRIVGLHFHAFSQHGNHRTLLAHHEKARNFVVQTRSVGFTPETVNLGSGMGLSYFEAAEEFDLRAYLEAASDLLNEIQRNLEPQGRIRMESGRYLVGGSGLFLTKIVRKKARSSGPILILDGGYAQNAMITGVHMPLRRNFKHQLLRAKEKPASDHVATYDAFGPSCSVNDVVLLNAALKSPEVGDFLCFENMGAYGRSFSPNRFLSFQEPEEHIL